MQNKCRATNCNDFVHGKRLCIKHYKRWTRHRTLHNPRSPMYRFKKYIGKSLGKDECWPWLGAIDSNGYGASCMSKGKKMGAHRMSWILFNGPIPDRMQVAHQCNNKPCVNPNHLYLATPKQNTQDAVRDGLIVSSIERNEAKAKLTRDEAMAIKKDKSTPRHILAKKYGVHVVTISRIRTGRRWAHLNS